MTAKFQSLQLPVSLVKTKCRKMSVNVQENIVKSKYNNAHQDTAAQ